ALEALDVELAVEPAAVGAHGVDPVEESELLGGEAPHPITVGGLDVLLHPGGDGRAEAVRRGDVLAVVAALPARAGGDGGDDRSAVPAVALLAVGGVAGFGPAQDMPRAARGGSDL